MGLSKLHFLLCTSNILLILLETAATAATAFFVVVHDTVLDSSVVQAAVDF